MCMCSMCIYIYVCVHIHIILLPRGTRLLHDKFQGETCSSYAGGVQTSTGQKVLESGLKTVKGWLSKLGSLFGYPK